MIDFKTKEELRDKLNPLLSSKTKELKKRKINISNDQLFDYLSKNKWSKTNDLRFFEIVDDIIKIDGDDFIEK